MVDYGFYLCIVHYWSCTLTLLHKQAIGVFLTVFVSAEVWDVWHAQVMLTLIKKFMRLEKRLHFWMRTQRNIW